MFAPPILTQSISPKTQPLKKDLLEYEIYRKEEVSFRKKILQIKKRFVYKNIIFRPFRFTIKSGPTKIKHTKYIRNLFRRNIFHSERFFNSSTYLNNGSILAIVDKSVKKNFYNEFQKVKNEFTTKKNISKDLKNQINTIKYYKLAEESYKLKKFYLFANFIEICKIYFKDFRKKNTAISNKKLNYPKKTIKNIFIKKYAYI